MPRTLAFQPIAIAGEPDSEGQLVLLEDRLLAVLVRLDDELHGEDRGAWFLEAAFGSLSDRAGMAVFRTLEQASEWIARYLAAGLS